MAISTPIPSEIRALLRQGKSGIARWNEWRDKNPDIRPDLREEDLSGADLTGVNLSEANLSGACFTNSNLCTANLWHIYASGGNFKSANLSSAYIAWSYLAYVSFDGADLRRATLKETDLTRSSFNGANLEAADLAATYLLGVDFTDAILKNAILEHARLIEADVSGATLADCFVYGISVWKLKGAPKDQSNLVITPEAESNIVVDNLKIAQFMYLLLDNAEIRDVIDTITSKVVLILGRFTPERKAVLDALRTKLRMQDYLPVLFDFEKPSSRNLTETISTLAHMARFVIADITDAKSIPQELQRIVPALPSLPVQPLILASQYEYGMFKDFLDYPWVLMPCRYQTVDDLLTSLEAKVIEPARMKAREIAERRSKIERELTK